MGESWEVEEAGASGVRIEVASTPLGQGAEYVVYAAGEGEVVKVPRVVSTVGLSPKKAKIDLGLLKSYGIPHPPTRVLSLPTLIFSAGRQLTPLYAILQERLQGRPLTLKDFQNQQVAAAVRGICEKAQQLCQEQALGADLVGTSVLVDVLRNISNKMLQGTLSGEWEINVGNLWWVNAPSEVNAPNEGNAPSAAASREQTPASQAAPQILLCDTGLLPLHASPPDLKAWATDPARTLTHAAFAAQSEALHSVLRHHAPQETISSPACWLHPIDRFVLNQFLSYLLNS